MNNTLSPLALSQQSLSPREVAESLRLFVANFHSRMLMERMFVQIVLFEASFTKSTVGGSAKSMTPIPSQEVEAKTGPQDSDHESNGCVARRREFYESATEMFSVEEVDQNKGGFGQNPLLQADNSSWQLPTNYGQHLEDDWDLNAERIFNKHRFGNGLSNSKPTLCPASCSLNVAEEPSIPISMESASHVPKNAKHPSADLLPQSVADLPVTAMPPAIVQFGPSQQQDGASFQPKKEAFPSSLQSPVEDGMAPPAEALNQRLPVLTQQELCSNFTSSIGASKQNFRPPLEALHQRPSRSGFMLHGLEDGYTCLYRWRTSLGGRWGAKRF